MRLLKVVSVMVGIVFAFCQDSGLDPALPAWSNYGAAGDIRDQFRGIDQGTYPSNKVISIGLTTSF